MTNFILSILFFISPARAVEQPLLTVGKSTVTVDEFNRRLSEARKQSLNPPTREQLLEDIIRLEVAVQEAEKMKLQEEPAMRDQIKMMLYDRYLVKKLGDKMDSVKVTEKDLKDYYQKRPELRLAHIFFAGKDAKQRASEVFSEAKKPKSSFQDLARQYTDDEATKNTGGDLGYQTRMTMPAALYDAAVGLKTGELKGPIETPQGFFILKLLDKRGYDLADKHSLRAAILNERRGKIFDDFFEKTKKGYKVEINQEALKSAIN